MPDPVYQALKARLQTETGFRSYGEIQQWLQTRYGLQVPYKTVHKTVRYRLKAKPKVARPRSRRQEQEGVVTFKKTACPAEPFGSTVQ